MNLFSNTLTLENDQLLLKPSNLEDLDGLYPIADQRIWTHSSTSIENREDMKNYLLEVIEYRKQQTRQQLTIIDKANNRLLGCSSFENVSEADKRLEIGWTWLGLAFQGKGYNKIAKYLMLSYVFDELKFERVEFRVRGTNIQSQKALAKIGAVKEGTLRSYFVAEGKRHNFSYFSILKEEWPGLRERVFGEFRG